MISWGSAKDNVRSQSSWACTCGGQGQEFCVTAEALKMTFMKGAVCRYAHVMVLASGVKAKVVQDRAGGVVHSKVNHPL